MKIIFILVGAIAALALIVYAAGSLTPRDHGASRRLVLKSATPETVWARIADATAAPQWRKDVKHVTRLPDSDGHEVWREEYTSGNTLAYETIESVPPSRLEERARKSL